MAKMLSSYSGFPGKNNKFYRILKNLNSFKILLAVTLKGLMIRKKITDFVA